MQDQPLVNETKTRLSTPDAFKRRFEKYTIAQKQEVISELMDILNAHKQRLIQEAEATIERLKATD